MLTEPRRLLLLGAFEEKYDHQMKFLTSRLLSNITRFANKAPSTTSDRKGFLDHNK